MTYFIGVDPDLHTTAIAVADLEEVIHLEVLRTSKLKGPEAVIDQAARARRALEEAQEAVATFSGYTQTWGWVYVESQRIYNRHDKSNPNSLILLAQVAGAYLCAAGAAGQLVLPQDWKQQQPKEVNQARTYEHYGWDHKKAKGYVVPTNHGFTNVKDSDWKHLGDALGIALWAAKEAETKAKREKWKAKK